MSRGRGVGALAIVLALALHLVPRDICDINDRTSRRVGSISTAQHSAALPSLGKKGVEIGSCVCICRDQIYLIDVAVREELQHHIT